MLHIFSRGIEYKKVYPPQIRSKNNTARDYKIKYGPPFKLVRFPNPVVELRSIPIKSMGIEVVAKIICNSRKQCFYHK